MLVVANQAKNLCHPRFGLILYTSLIFIELPLTVYKRELCHLTADRSIVADLTEDRKTKPLVDVVDQFFYDVEIVLSSLRVE
jgi:hypothetical protein